MAYSLKYRRYRSRRPSVHSVTELRAERNYTLWLRFDDGPGPALLSSAVYGAASDLTGDIGARALVAARPDDVRDVRIDGPAPRDVDEPGDLTQI